MKNNDEIYLLYFIEKKLKSVKFIRINFWYSKDEDVNWKLQTEEWRSHLTVLFVEKKLKSALRIYWQIFRNILLNFRNLLYFFITLAVFLCKRKRSWNPWNLSKSIFETYYLLILRVKIINWRLQTKTVMISCNVMKRNSKSTKIIWINFRNLLVPWIEITDEELLFRI